MSAAASANARRLRVLAGVLLTIRKQRTTLQARARQQLQQHMLDGQQHALDDQQGTGRTLETLLGCSGEIRQRRHFSLAKPVLVNARATSAALAKKR